MYLELLIVPLMFGFASNTGDSWQTTFCEIGLLNSLDFLQCDKLQDRLMLEEGDNIDIDLIVENDTVKFTVVPSTITVQTSTWFGNDTDVISNHIYFVSDGSIIFNVTESYP